MLSPIRRRLTRATPPDVVSDSSLSLSKTSAGLASAIPRACTWIS
jgi:hypothetical protein